MQIKTTVLLTKTTNNSVDIKINDLKMKNAIFHILPQLKLECFLNVTVVVSKWWWYMGHCIECSKLVSLFLFLKIKPDICIHY